MGKHPGSPASSALLLRQHSVGILQLFKPWNPSAGNNCLGADILSTIEPSSPNILTHTVS